MVVEFSSNFQAKAEVGRFSLRVKVERPILVSESHCRRYHRFPPSVAYPGPKAFAASTLVKAPLFSVKVVLQVAQRFQCNALCTCYTFLPDGELHATLGFLVSLRPTSTSFCHTGLSNHAHSP